MTEDEAGQNRPAVSPAAETWRDRSVSLMNVAAVQHRPVGPPLGADARHAPRVYLSGNDVALFASDMHLGEHDPETARKFLSALEREASTISHLFLLGDLFEAWVGDDQPDAIARQLIDALSRLRTRGVWIGVMVGNRDFLLDEPIAGVSSFSARTGALVLEDPSLIELFGERVLIAHGDAWCLTDIDYQRFRAEVRTRSWQQAFLSRPLPERLAIARQMRDESEMRRTITDVTPTAVADAMRLHGVRKLIHGHTHQPGDYRVTEKAPEALIRHVLPDWSAAESRGGFIRVDRTGWSRPAA